MGALTGQTIADSYEQLLHVDRDGGGNGATLVNVKDGDNDTTFALQLSTEAIVVDNPTASAADKGGILTLQSDDGAAMASGHRLGIVQFSGAEDASSTITEGAKIEAICDAGWSATENGTELRFSITDGNASSSEVLRLAPALTTSNQGIKMVGTDAAVQLQFFDDSNSVFQLTQAEYSGSGGNKNIFAANNSTAIAFNTGGSERFLIDKDGQGIFTIANIGTFNLSPTAATGDSSTDNYSISFQGDRGNGFRFQHNVTSRNIQIIAGNNGVVLAGGGTSFSAISSDERLKQNWNIFQNATDKINTLTKIGEYQMKDPDTGEFPIGKDADGSELIQDEKHYGLSAQEIESILPEAVHTNSNGYKGLCYQDVFVLALKAIQELSARIKVLEDA